MLLLVTLFNWRILRAFWWAVHLILGLLKGWSIKKWISTFIIVKMAWASKVHRNIWLTEGTLYASWSGLCYFTENSSKYYDEHLLLKDNRFFYVYHQFHWHRNAQEHMVHSILSQPFYVSMETLFLRLTDAVRPRCAQIINCLTFFYNIMLAHIWQIRYI